MEMMCKVTNCSLAPTCARNATSGTVPGPAQVYLHINPSRTGPACAYYETSAIKLATPAPAPGIPNANIAPPASTSAPVAEPLPVHVHQPTHTLPAPETPVSAAAEASIRAQIKSVSYHEYDQLTFCMIRLLDGHVYAGVAGASQTDAYNQALAQAVQHEPASASGT